MLTLSAQNNAFPVAAATELLEDKAQFALFALPGQHKFHLAVGERAASSTPVFEIIPWLGKCSESIKLYSPEKVYTGISHVRNKSSEIHRYIKNNDISQADYIKAVEQIIETCKKEGGKTVYSREITVDAPSSDPSQVAARFFERFPNTFRFFFSTSETSAWLGASPETLLDFDAPTSTLSTMALAGTRPAGAEGPWDAKNIQENQFVTDYIVRQLENLGLCPLVGGLETVTFGPIEHLCRRISAKMPRFLLDVAIDALNPTPALCGTPKERAVNLITRLEPHQRGCYGGALRVNLPNGSCRVFVTLRCCSFQAHTFRLYAGGGITAQSDPLEEWEETQAKASSLLHEILSSEHVTSKPENRL